MAAAPPPKEKEKHNKDAPFLASGHAAQSPDPATRSPEAPRPRPAARAFERRGAAP